MPIPINEGASFTCCSTSKPCCDNNDDVCCNADENFVTDAFLLPDGPDSSTGQAKSLTGNVVGSNLSKQCCEYIK
jgi:hypothetical protein